MEKITKKTIDKMNQLLLEKNIDKLNDTLLRRNKYNIDILEKNIQYLSLRTLLYTQDLTPEFCAKYILDENYASCIEDTYIDFGDILNAQKHITKSHLLDAIRKLE
jgi:hypothetical protein